MRLSEKINGGNTFNFLNSLNEGYSNKKKLKEDEVPYDNTSEKVCPRCGDTYTDFPALSRRDNKTEICPDCGAAEAMEDYTNSLKNESEEAEKMNEALKEVKIKFECEECGYIWSQEFKDYFEDEDDLLGVIENGEMDCPKCKGNYVTPKSWDIIEEAEKMNKCGKKILTEVGTDSTLDKLLSGDELYFRDQDGLALMIRYANNYPNPEEYDQGYTTGWERGADEEFDKAQDERFNKAKTANENREVWEVLEVDETTLQPNGDVYGYVYGEEELEELLAQLREVRVTKRLEEDTPALDAATGAIDDAVGALQSIGGGAKTKGAGDAEISASDAVDTGAVDTHALTEGKLEDYIGGNYDDFINDLQEFKNILYEASGKAASHLANQIIDETIEDFFKILNKYEYSKDIEITSAIK